MKHGLVENGRSGKSHLPQKSRGERQFRMAQFVGKLKGFARARGGRLIRPPHVRPAVWFNVS